MSEKVILITSCGRLRQLAETVEFIHGQFRDMMNETIMVIADNTPPFMSYEQFAKEHTTDFVPDRRFFCTNTDILRDLMDRHDRIELLKRDWRRNTTYDGLLIRDGISRALDIGACRMFKMDSSMRLISNPFTCSKSNGLCAIKSTQVKDGLSTSTFMLDLTNPFAADLAGAKAWGTDKMHDHAKFRKAATSCHIAVFDWSKDASSVLFGGLQL